MTAAESATGIVQLPELPAADPTCRGAQRARSITNAADTAAHLTVPATQRDMADRGRDAARRAEAWLKEITTGGSLLHAKPPSLAECREHHRYAAGHFTGTLPRALRTAYGYWHLSVKAVLHIIEWVLESPPRLVVAVIILGVIRFTV